MYIFYGLIMLGIVSMGLDFKIFFVLWDEDKRKFGKVCCSLVLVLVMCIKFNRFELERFNRCIYNIV